MGEPRVLVRLWQPPSAQRLQVVVQQCCDIRILYTTLWKAGIRLCRYRVQRRVLLWRSD